MFLHSVVSFHANLKGDRVRVHGNSLLYSWLLALLIFKIPRVLEPYHLFVPIHLISLAYHWLRFN
jgi:hypothetical protein